MRTWTIAILLLACIAVSAQETAIMREEAGSTAVMLQGYHWYSHNSACWWDTVAARADDIASEFSIVWLPPSSGSASKEGYLPHRLYLQDSAYGNQARLTNAVTALHARGLMVIADIVINHRVGTKDWADFTDPQWGSDAVCKDDEWKGASGNYDTGGGYHAARDIDHTQVYVQNGIVQWMGWLKSEIGYDGWRFDYTKGYSGQYNKIYNQRTNPQFSVGEFWDDLDLNNANAHRQRLCDWIDATGSTSAAFDFTTKGVLQQAVAHNEYWRLKDGQGKPVGLIGWWPARAVTFIDNHDTGPSPGGGQNHWPFPGDKVMMGYAYILTHPGVPCVYWVHYYDWGLKEPIRDLIRLRKNAGITSVSAVSIQCADSGKYAAVIDGKIAVKIGAGDWSPGSGWLLQIYGNNYAVWQKK